VFFSDDPADVARARSICRTCPVQAECLGYALAAEHDDGTWGGTTPEERAELVERLRKTGVTGWHKVAV
jgi:WhiB family redox-sensing transcriptional regulator